MNDEIIKIEHIIEIVTESTPVVEIVDTTPKVEVWMTAPGPKGDPGQPGPKGDKGDDGASSPTYVHSQDSPALVWTVVHNLNKFPSVSVVDSANTVVYGLIEYINEQSLTLTFSALFSGRVYCN